MLPFAFSERPIKCIASEQGPADQLITKSVREESASSPHTSKALFQSKSQCPIRMALVARLFLSLISGFNQSLHLIYLDLGDSNSATGTLKFSFFEKLIENL